MRLIILTPNALHDVYTVSAGQDFFSMLRFLLKHERKKKEEKISIPLGFTIWPAEDRSSWDGTRPVQTLGCLAN